MPGEVALDTSVVVAHLRNDGAITRRLRAARVLYMPAIAVGEIWFGAARAAVPERAAVRVAEFLSIVSVLPVDAETAKSYGEIKRTLAAAGTPIPENDIWIAACAVRSLLPLAARDPHFSRIQGLTVLDW
jgi:tRNA(fMet)-specific endonuclease VapC